MSQRPVGSWSHHELSPSGGRGRHERSLSGARGPARATLSGVRGHPEPSLSGVCGQPFPNDLTQSSRTVPFVRLEPYSEPPSREFRAISLGSSRPCGSHPLRSSGRSLLGVATISLGSCPMRLVFPTLEYICCFFTYLYTLLHKNTKMQ